MQDTKCFLVIFQDPLSLIETKELQKKLDILEPQNGLTLDGIFKQRKEIKLILDPNLIKDASRIEQISKYSEIEIGEIVGRIFPDKNFLIQLLIE